MIKNFNFDENMICIFGYLCMVLDEIKSLGCIFIVSNEYNQSYNDVAMERLKISILFGYSTNYKQLECEVTRELS